MNLKIILLSLFLPCTTSASVVDSLQVILSKKMITRDSLATELAIIDSAISEIKTHISRLQYQSQLGVELVLIMDGKMRPEPKSSVDPIAIIPSGTKVKATWYGNSFYKTQTPNHGEGYLHSVYIQETDVVKIFTKDQEVLRQAEKSIVLNQRKKAQEEKQAARIAKEKKEQAMVEKAAEAVRARTLKERQHQYSNLVSRYRGVISQAIMNDFQEGRLSIGMPEDMVLFVAGWPSDRNVTKSRSGTREQWVYDHPNTDWKYLYIVNGILDAMQN